MHASSLLSVGAVFLAAVSARPVIEARNPQDSDRPGFFPEITSLIASLAGDGQSAVISAIYGNTQASSALMAASSAAAAGDQGAVESYWSQATEAVGDTWTSYTSAYDSNRSSDEGTWSGEWSSVPEPTTSSTSSSRATFTPAPTTTPVFSGVGSGANGSPTASETGAAEQRLAAPILAGVSTLAAFFLVSLA